MVKNMFAQPIEKQQHKMGRIFILSRSREATLLMLRVSGWWFYRCFMSLEDSSSIPNALHFIVYNGRQELCMLS